MCKCDFLIAPGPCSEGVSETLPNGLRCGCVSVVGNRIFKIEFVDAHDCHALMFACSCGYAECCVSMCKCELLLAPGPYSEGVWETRPNGLRCDCVSVVGNRILKIEFVDTHDCHALMFACS